MYKKALNTLFTQTSIVGQSPASFHFGSKIKIKKPLPEYLDDLMRKKYHMVAKARQNRLDTKPPKGRNLPKPLNESGYLALP